MEKPLEITYRDLTPTPTIESAIRSHVAKLETVCDHIVSCTVALENREKNQSAANDFRVRVAVRVPPRHELVGTHDEGKGSTPDNGMASIKEAFDAVERQLRKLNERQHGL